MRHEIHQTINKKQEAKFEPVQAGKRDFDSLYRGRPRELRLPAYREYAQRQAVLTTADAKIKNGTGEKEQEPLSPFEQQMELKAKLKKELEACEVQLKVLVEKAKPDAMAEMFLPQYASRGVIGFLARTFQPKPKIDQKDLQAIIGRMRSAQRKFNDAYYSFEEKVDNTLGAERFAVKYEDSKTGKMKRRKKTTEDKMANRLSKRAHGTMGGFLPLDEHMQGQMDLVDVWRSLTKEISQLDEDLSTPMTMTDSHRGEIKASTRQHAGAEEVRIKALRQREAEIKETSKRHIRDAKKILQEIMQHGGELSGRATEYLTDLSQLNLATAASDENLIRQDLATFKELHEALLEKGVAIKSGQDAIDEAEEALITFENARVLPKKTLKNRAVRAITSSRKAKSKKKTEIASDAEEEEAA